MLFSSPAPLRAATSLRGRFPPAGRALRGGRGAGRPPAPTLRAHPGPPCCSHAPPALFELLLRTYPALWEGPGPRDGHVESFLLYEHPLCRGMLGRAQLLRPDGARAVAHSGRPEIGSCFTSSRRRGSIEVLFLSPPSPSFSFSCHLRPKITQAFTPGSAAHQSFGSFALPCISLTAAK